MKEIAGGGEKRRCRQSIFDHGPALGNRVVVRGRGINPPNPYQKSFVIFAKTILRKCANEKIFQPYFIYDPSLMVWRQN
jgi:hypothetical protein